MNKDIKTKAALFLAAVNVLLAIAGLFFPLASL